MSHQNSAKRLKALLRRTHFPVARLKQVPGGTGHGGPGPGAGCGGGGGGGGAGANPWDGIVTGEPRAALVVLHWTLLDMSPLFSSLLLDRGYVGLQSLTDFKFVSHCLKMLRDEFNLRPQVTVSRLPQRSRERGGGGQRERENDVRPSRRFYLFYSFCQTGWVKGCQTLGDVTLKLRTRSITKERCFASFLLFCACSVGASFVSFVSLSPCLSCVTLAETSTHVNSSKGSTYSLALHFCLPPAFSRDMELY